MISEPIELDNPNVLIWHGSRSFRHCQIGRIRFTHNGSTVERAGAHFIHGADEQDVDFTQYQTSKLRAAQPIFRAVAKQFKLFGSELAGVSAK